MKKNFKILYLLSIFSVTAAHVFSMDSCVLTEDMLTEYDLLRRDPCIIIANSDVNLCDENGQTALHHAAISGHADFITQLLDRDADPQICDSKGMIPLFYAEIGKRHANTGNHANCAKILLKNRAQL